MIWDLKTWLTLGLILHSGPLGSAHNERTALERPVVLKTFRGTTADAVAALLAQARLSGGIVSVTDGCAPPDQRVIELGETTLRQGLEYISAIDSSRRWVFSGNQVLVGNQLLEKTILDTFLHKVVIRIDDPLTLSTQRLLQSKEVQRKLARIRLDELSPALGFSKVSAQSTETSGHSDDTNSVKRFSDARLYEALNMLAAAKGASVWHYEQFNCGSRRSFRISWVVS